MLRPKLTPETETELRATLRAVRQLAEGLASLQPFLVAILLRPGGRSEFPAAIGELIQSLTKPKTPPE